MSNTPVVPIHGTSHLLAEGRFKFITTFLNVSILAIVVSVSATMPAIMPDLVSSPFLKAASSLRRVNKSWTNELFLVVIVLMAFLPSEFSTTTLAMTSRALASWSRTWSSSWLTALAWHPIAVMWVSLMTWYSYKSRLALLKNLLKLSQFFSMGWNTLQSLQ